MDLSDHMEELICLEESSQILRKAPVDPTLICDDRVLLNLLNAEDCYKPSLAYFKFQKEIKPFMRKTVVSWLLEVCEEQKREDDVFPLTVNLLDRVLSTVQIKKSRLQLVACVCLFIASKIKECYPIDPLNLVMYTDYSVLLSELKEWELLILQILKWDTNSIIPNDFLLPLLHKLPVPHEYHHCVLRHSSTFIALCAIDFNLATQSPSNIAASSLLASIKGVLPSFRSNAELNRILHLLNFYTGIDIEYIESCASQMELILTNNYTAEHPSHISISGSVTPPNDKTHHPTLPSTPTDVLDVIVNT